MKKNRKISRKMKVRLKEFVPKEIRTTKKNITLPHEEMKKALQSLSPQ